MRDGTKKKSKLIRAISSFMLHIGAFRHIMPLDLAVRLAFYCVKGDYLNDNQAPRYEDIHKIARVSQWPLDISAVVLPVAKVNYKDYPEHRDWMFRAMAYLGYQIPMIRRTEVVKPGDNIMGYTVIVDPELDAPKMAYLHDYGVEGYPDPRAIAALDVEIIAPTDEVS